MLCGHFIPIAAYKPMTEYQNSRALFCHTIRGLVLILVLGTGWFSLASVQVVLPKTIILVRHAEKKIVPPENKDPE